MKMSVMLSILLLLVASVIFYQGYIYSEYNNVIIEIDTLESQNISEKKIKIIDDFRSNRWFWPLQKYPSLDILGINKRLDYNKAIALANVGKLDEAHRLFDNSGKSHDTKLAADSLYSQGNIALYQGNLKLAQKKWQQALEKYGTDFDSHVNLELVNQRISQSKALAVSIQAILNHRRSKDLGTPLRQFNSKKGPIKP
ncbi:MAG TPA: hypothetical protein VJH71_01130 [Candidatus Paceibacterota bacterium]